MLLNTYQQQLINTRYVSHIETTLHMKGEMPNNEHSMTAHINGKAIVIYQGDYYIVDALYRWLCERLTPNWDGDFWDINPIAKGYEVAEPEPERIS